MNKIVRNHEFSIWNLKFKHSDRFCFKNKDHYTSFTDQLILNHEAHVYKKFEDDFNLETLHIKVSKTIGIYVLSFFMLFLAYFYIQQLLISNFFIGLSILLFTIGHILKIKYQKFAFAIDVSRELLTDELIDDVRRELQIKNLNSSNT